jgi:hypothetical protein
MYAVRLYKYIRNQKKTKCVYSGLVAHDQDQLLLTSPAEQELPPPIAHAHGNIQFPAGCVWGTKDDGSCPKEWPRLLLHTTVTNL